MSQKPVSENLKGLIAILFVTSGATGLIYQVVWFKYLAIFLGSTTYAQMIVLSAFLGGLALGNHFAGLRADRLKNPVMVYSILEILIGIYCFLYPVLSHFAGDIFIAAAKAGDMSDTQGFLFVFVRSQLSISLLLLPTMAMGATLPVLSKAFVDKRADSRRDLAILYGLNSLGAVGGVLFAGFVLIKFFGLNTTLYISATVNIIIGIVGAVFSYFYFRENRKEPEGEAEEKPEEAAAYIPGQPAGNTALLKLVILIAGTSGFAALMYEMVWVRLLIHIFGSSTYAFSLMLMAFISGITIGSMIASSKMFNSMNKVRVVAFSQAAIALSTLPVLLIYERLIYYFWVTASLMVKNDTTFDIYLFIQFAVCFMLILVPTVFMGITLPVIVEIVREYKQGIGASVGRVFSVNTVGTVLGSVLTGLLFIPWLGMRGTFELGIFINLAGAAALAYFTPDKTKANRYILAGSAAVVFVMILSLTPDWNVKLSMASVFRRLSVEPPKTYAQFLEVMEQRDVLYYKEGMNANVSIVQYRDTTKTIALIINGKADASNGDDMSTQVLSAQIPMLLHKDPKDVFVVGLGSGVTVGSVLTHPVKEVTCVEISKEVVESAKFFAKENNNCMENPKLKMLVEDAHTFMKLTPKQFDVIISEPSNPWIAGIGNLFSVEYFNLCRSKLKKGGIMLQWFHIYEMDDDILKLVMNTYAQAFPYTQVWNPGAGDILMVGSEEDIAMDAEEFTKRFNIPAVKQNMEMVGLNTPFSMLSLQMLSQRGFYAVSDYPEVNSELHPLLEFRAPRSLFKGRNAKVIFLADERFKSSFGNLLIERYIQKYPPDNPTLLDAARYQLSRPKTYRLIHAFTKQALQNNPRDYEAAKLHLTAIELLNLQRIRTPIVNSLAKNFGDEEHWRSIYLYDKINEEMLGSSFLGRGKIDGYVDSLIQISRKDSISQVKMYVEIANAYYQNDEQEKAFLYSQKVQELLNASPELGIHIRPEEFIRTAAMSAAYMGEFKAAINYLMALIGLNSEYEEKDYMMRSIKLMIQGE